MENTDIDMKIYQEFESYLKSHLGFEPFFHSFNIPNDIKKIFESVGLYRSSVQLLKECIIQNTTISESELKQHQ